MNNSLSINFPLCTDTGKTSPLWVISPGIDGNCLHLRSFFDLEGVVLPQNGQTLVLSEWNDDSEEKKGSPLAYFPTEKLVLRKKIS